MRRVLLLTAAVAVAGCAGDQAWMPLEEGRTWTYRVRGQHYQFVESVTVGESTAVGSALGRTLEGALGHCRLGWIDGELRASLIGTSHFLPELPLFRPDRSDRAWQGQLFAAGKAHKATAKLTHKPEKITVAGARYDAIRADLELRYDGHVVEWTSWFSQGVGIVRQEQRTDGSLDVSLELIRGS